nr:hypothetical protein [Vibrio alginolyticus]
MVWVSKVVCGNCGIVLLTP